MRWVALVVFVAICGTVFVNLGEWQLRRLHERRAGNAIILANEHAPVAAFGNVFTHPITDADQWRRVSVTGRFDAAHQFLVRFRSIGDTDGYEVLTPLATDSPSTGSVAHVIVDRGFLPLSGGQQIPDTAPLPPTGVVTVVGHVRRDERGSKGAIRPVNGQVRLVNAVALQAALPYPLVNGYIGLLQVTPPQNGNFSTIPLPEISDGPHFWYAVQWFMFTCIGIAGVVVFIRGDIRDRREARSAEAGAGSDPHPGRSTDPVPAGDRG